VRLAAKLGLRQAPVRRVAATPDELPRVAECARTVFLHQVAHVQAVAPRQMAKPEARQAPVQPVAAALDERLPVAERALEVLPPLAVAHAPAASPQRAAVRDA
jgi:hypothetical protein